jgi:Family of unknown function (DUF6186)
VTSRDLTLNVWTGLALCLLVLGLVSAVRPTAVPTLRAVVGSIVSNLAGRILLVIGWMWLGWHLFAR